MVSFKHWGLNIKGECCSSTEIKPRHTHSHRQIRTLWNVTGWVVLHKTMVSHSGQRSGLLKTPHGSDYFLLCWSSTQTEPILTTWAQRHRVIRPGEPCFDIPAATTLSAETHTLHTTRREEKGKTKDKEQVKEIWERGFLQRDPKHAITLQ